MFILKFKDMKYNRPDMNAASTITQELIDNVNQAADEQDVLDAFALYEQVSDDIDTSATLSSIQHTVDTTNAFYEEENNYFDEQMPILVDKSLDFYRAVLASPYKNAIQTQYGDIMLSKMEVAVQSADNRLIELKQAENALETEYEKLYASAKIPFQGKTLTISQFGPYQQSTNREIRRAAFEAIGTFFDKHQEEFDTIYDKMVKNRTEQAKLLGYSSFTPLGDIRMGRIGYTRKDIKACRDAVAKDIVPLVAKLKERQRERLEVSALKFYDDSLSFKDGNPTPKGTPDEILAAGQEMYRSLSPETGQFMDFMMENDLFDVLSKPGKAPGGYCTYIPKYKSPFIFSNFNGTSGDVDVLTHEAGHAFAFYVAGSMELASELRMPGLESCEIHSMSMEFLTSKYHHLFFKEDTQKYTISHAEDALFFLPYGCQVDEFQEIIYDNPNLTPKQRHECWLELEKKYRPWNDFEDLPFYSRGAGWQRQLHIYESPFYYIDYVLAQSVALQVFQAYNDNPKKAWESYMHMVELAGTADYRTIVERGGFITPFEEGALSLIGNSTYQWLLKQSV